MNENVKKKKYWLLPIIFFVAGIISFILVMIPTIMAVKEGTNAEIPQYLTILKVIMMPIMVISIFGFIPSIVVAIIQSNKNK